MFGLSRTIYVNAIHILCTISTITLIITAVKRTIQMATRRAETLNLLQENVPQLLSGFVFPETLAEKKETIGFAH